MCVKEVQVQTELEWVRKIRTGDGEAFEQLFRSYCQPLIHFVRRYVRLSPLVLWSMDTPILEIDTAHSRPAFLRKSQKFSHFSPFFRRRSKARPLYRHRKAVLGPIRYPPRSSRPWPVDGHACLVLVSLPPWKSIYRARQRDGFPLCSPLKTAHGWRPLALRKYDKSLCFHDKPESSLTLACYPTSFSN